MCQWILLFKKGQIRYTERVLNKQTRTGMVVRQYILKEGEENMVETFFKEQGIYYVIGLLCLLGIMGRAYESRIYNRLVQAVDNPERTEHPFMKQLKLKYKNYYQLERRINNTDAFIETSLYKYKHHLVRLESLHSSNSRIMLLCIIASCTGIAGCVHYEMENRSFMYYILAGAVAVAVLELAEQQFGIGYKRRMLFVTLKDYLENGLSNQLAGHLQEEKLSGKKEAGDKKEKKKFKLQGEAQQQMAVTETIAEKVASELTQEKLIVDVIKEFFP